MLSEMFPIIYFYIYENDLRVERTYCMMFFIAIKYKQGLKNIEIKLIVNLRFSQYFIHSRNYCITMTSLYLYSLIMCYCLQYPV